MTVWVVHYVSVNFAEGPYSIVAGVYASRLDAMKKLAALAGAEEDGDTAEVIGMEVRAEGSGCPTCADIHPACRDCGAATRCPSDEVGQPFIYCDGCDANQPL